MSGTSFLPWTIGVCGVGKADDKPPLPVPRSLIGPGRRARRETDALDPRGEPLEAPAGMAFPLGSRWLGSRRDRVKLAGGNAVCPPRRPHMTSHTGRQRVPLPLVWFLGVVMAVLAGGCGAVPPLSAPVALGAVGQLESLTVIPRPRDDGTYRRAAFGRAWADVDANRCRQRADVLARDVDRRQPFTMRTTGACTHEMVSGTWYDAYSGRTLTFTNLRDPHQAQALPVDHTVSLATMWRYGARDWTDQQRLIAANDLDNLVVTSGKVNSSKGGLDAAAWQPLKAAQCGYASRYVIIKARYRLGVDTSEKAALRQMLATCRNAS